MAIDSRDKRFSIMGMGDETAGLMPLPDGGFSTAADRKMLLGVYHFAATIFVANVLYYAIFAEGTGYRAELA